MPHHNTFRLQLGTSHPDFGHALWHTSPGEQYPPVEVGDVGFIREGKFHRVFNALYSENHPYNQRFGVPGDHERLPPVPNHLDRGTLYPTNFCTSGVTATSVTGGSNIYAVEPPPPGFAEVTFSCAKKQGAVLSLPVTARREDTISRDHFRKWILRHIDSWFAFTQRLGLGIEMEDIVLVTGYHRTRSSSNIVFYESQVNSQVSFGVQVPGIIGTTVNWQASSQYTRGTMVNHGPSGENLPENQCMFIRGYRVERTFRIFPKKIRAAAEPKKDPSGNDEQETQVVSIPGVTDYRDPLHVLLEYIAERVPDCDLVVVHDDDLKRILRGGNSSSSLTSLEALQPAEVMDHLRRSELEIGVMSYSWLANDTISRPATEILTAAMLSEQLTSSVSLPSGSHLVGATNRRESAQYDSPSYSSELATPSSFQDAISEPVKGIDQKGGFIIRGGKGAAVAIRQISNQVSDVNWKELRKDLRKWIAPPDPSVNFNAASSAHLEGTTVWCTKWNILADWIKSGSLLWIHGKPGSGKSILSSVIIESMFNAGSAFLAYFYFDFRDTAKQDSHALLSSILVQLSDQSDIFCHILFALYSAHNQGSEQPTDDSLAQCLKEMLVTTGKLPIYLIIDALDECPNDSVLPSSREKVLKLVKDLVGLHQPNLRLYITSRPEFDIRTTLEPLATQQVSLQDESGLKQDINDYVNIVVRSDRMMKKWREDDKDAVIESLTQRADGMFRWVSCQLEVLRYCLTTNIRRVLKEFPKSLDETYIRILHNVNSTDRVHVYRILQCIVGAGRPLRVEELVDVLAFDLTTKGIPKLFANSRWKGPEEAVLSTCSSLVAVVVDDGSRVVQFSHFSVEEFLTSDRLANSTEEVSQFHIPIETCHAILAQACLSVLLHFGDCTDKASIKGKIPLLQYAAEYWYRHAAIGNVEFQITDVMDRFFDMDEPYFSAWVQIQDQFDLLTFSESEQPRAVPLPAAPFYFAARMGFCGLVERLVLKHPQQVNHLGGLYGTPLHASVLGGHIEVAKLLFAYGADVNSRSADNWTPLHIASREGHLEIGKLLLKLGANVSFQKDGQTPLHFATSHGHLEVARLLLKYNAEVNAGSNLGSTPLLNASLNGTPDIVRLLLNHNADAHVRGDNGDTSLHLAATYGHLKVARLLLEHNAEVDLRNDLGSTPLLGASSNGSPDVVRLLLDHNADARVRDNNGDTPLHLAATYGHLEAAQLLLERNADVDSRNILGSTPLLDASANGNPDVTRLLLDHNANVHVQDNNGDTPLHLATTYGHLEVVRLLLKHSGEVNALNDLGSTPLSKALTNGNPDVVRLLLDNGADAHVRNSNGDTPLHSAATYGHLEVVRLLLLEHNAEVNALNDLGSTPLLKALENGNPDVVRILLDNGAAGA